MTHEEQKAFSDEIPNQLNDVFIRRENRKGFTLVELIFIVGILALIVWAIKVWLM